MFTYIIYLLLSPILVLLIAILSLFNHKVRKNFINGLATRNKAQKYINKNSSGRDIIITHAASAGEFEQLKPVLREIDRDKYLIIQTFLSPTIYENNSDESLFDISCYHPLDFPWSAFLFLNSFKPKMYITTRHDIWPHHLVIAKLLNIKCYLINGNLYQGSKRFHPLAKSFNKFIFNKFDQILTGSEKLKNTLSQMAPNNKIYVTGDSRFDQIKYRSDNSINLNQLHDDFKYIALGSIDESDIMIVKDAMSNLQDKVKYIIAPHEINPNMLLKIESMLSDINITYTYLSKINNQKLKDYDCIIIDSIGILLDIYKYTDIAYVGAGFSTGVHSVIEPLAQNCIVCYGPKIDILDEAVEITNLNVGHQINNSEELMNVFKLINDTKSLLKIQSNGKNYIRGKLGASKKIAEILNKA